MREFAKMYAERLVTAEEFARMPEEPGIVMELVRGRVVRMVAPGVTHGVVAARICGALLRHVDERTLGIVVTPVGAKIDSNPDTVRVPDVSFISRERMPPEGFSGFMGAPDLAVEVLSPSDRPGRMRDKIAQYLDTGVRLVWVVDPRRRSVTVHAPGKPPGVLAGDARLDGGEVLPEFSCDLSAIFR